ncbi:MAG: hypothetical protein U0Q18_01150 [Bryobacteraceae bacterium]
MFTWICPTCGREVPPSYDECPDCAARAKQGGTAQAGAQQPPPPPAVSEIPTAPPTAPTYGAAPATLPPMAHHARTTAMPTWLLSIVFAFAFAGLGASALWLVHYLKGGDKASANAPIETVPLKGSAKEHPMQKYVEVMGIRFIQTPKKDTEARFVVVNHSGADITDLAGSVNIWGRTARSDEEAAGNFQFKVSSLGPNESKELTAPVNTKLKVYELPDWQNITPEVLITSP